MKRPTKNHGRLLAAAAAVVMPATANAQFAAPGVAASERPSASSGNELQNIVVTAQRREQRFNDVGLAVSVLTGADLGTTGGTSSFVDLGGQVPNVQIKNVLAGDITNVTIRGIGLNDYAVNNNPAAGIYVDNVYLVSPAMLAFGLFDVDRVEVLKGPQGDLYGRNTTAGAVNIISRKPSDKTDVELEVGYGSYRNWHVDGAAGGALTDTLNARFAFQTVQQDSGWQTNYVTGKRIGKVDRTSGRLQLEWKPADSLRVLVAGHAGYDRSDAPLYKSDNVTTTEEDAYANRPRVSGASQDPRQDTKARGVSATIDWSINPELTLTSISAYEHLNRRHVEDSDGTSLQQLDGIFANRINQYSQEVRLGYSRENLNLIGGAFYSRDTVATVDSYGARDLLPLLGLPGLDVIGNTYRQRTRDYAAFLHGEWTFAPQLTLVAGARYTDERKNFSGVTTFLGLNGVNSNVFPPVASSFSTSKLSGKIGLNYKFTDQTLIYGSVSKGFKSGGFQGQLTFDPAAIKPFKNENLTAYEVGIKSRVLPNLQINAAVFDYEYHDAQFYGPLFDSPLGVLFGIANVGDARVRGAEADASWRPAAGLDLRAGAGFIDTKITKSIVAGVAQGSRLPNAPKLTLNGTAKYQWDLNDRTRADITLAGSYQSRIAFDIVRNPPQAREGGYFIGNAEVGVSLGEHFRLSAFGKNLFNELYRTQALNTSIGWTYFYGPPRTFGVNLSYKL